MIKKDALKEFEFSTNTFRILNITTCWMFGLVWFLSRSRVCIMTMMMIYDVA